MAFSFGVDFFDHSSTNDLDRRNQLELYNKESDGISLAYGSSNKTVTKYVGTN